MNTGTPAMKHDGRKTTWAWVVYLVQIPLVVGYSTGRLPIHPIVVMLPLVGLLNERVERRGRDGLGLIIVRPGRSLLLAALLSALLFCGNLIAFRMEGISLHLPPLTAGTLLRTATDLIVAVFIIAPFEEIVCRGYIQTRLQEAYGFWGVIVTALLFASLHLPSAWLEFGYRSPTALLYFAQVALSGLVLGYVYRQTGSVLTTIAIHGLQNFAWSISLRLGGMTASEMHATQIPFQLLWLLVQMGVALGAFPPRSRR